MQFVDKNNQNVLSVKNMLDYYLHRAWNINGMKIFREITFNLKIADNEKYSFLLINSIEKKNDQFMRKNSLDIHITTNGNRN